MWELESERKYGLKKLKLGSRSTRYVMISKILFYGYKNKVMSISLLHNRLIDIRVDVKIMRRLLKKNVSCLTILLSCVLGLYNSSLPLDYSVLLNAGTERPLSRSAGPDQFLMLDGLDPYTTYEIRVQACQAGTVELFILCNK